MRTPGLSLFVLPLTFLHLIVAPEVAQQRVLSNLCAVDVYGVGCVCHDLAHSACFKLFPLPRPFFPGLHLKSVIRHVLTGRFGV